VNRENIEDLVSRFIGGNVTLSQSAPSGASTTKAMIERLQTDVAMVCRPVAISPAFIFLICLVVT
jgi:hypothetical protein